MNAALQRGVIIGAVVVTLLGAISVAIKAHDDRIRAETLWKAEVAAVTAHADSVLQTEKDSGAVRTARDSAERKAIRDSLATEKTKAAVLRAVATSAGEKADSLTNVIAAATNPRDSLTAAMSALAARSRETTQWRQTSEREAAAREIAERGLERMTAKFDSLQAHVDTELLPLIADMRDRLNDSVISVKRAGLFTRMFRLARDALAVVGVVAVAVAVAGR